MDPTELSVPLEVLERALRLAFEPTDLPSFTPAPFPPRGTSHLLLVSRGVRELCLPHFWRAVTVAQPSDWVTLFDHDTGLLAVGEEGRRRWGWVEELNIVLEAEIPVSMVPDETSEYSGGASPNVGLHLLDLPSFRRLPRLVFHHLREENEPRHRQWKAAEAEAEKTIGQLVMLLRPPKDAHYGPEPEPIRNYILKVTGHPETAVERAKRIVDRFWTDMDNRIPWKRELHLRRVLRSLRPIYLQMPSTLIVTIPYPDDDDDARIVKPEKLELSGIKRNDLPDYDTFFNVEAIWTDRVQVRLVGFSEEVLEDIEQWIGDRRPEVDHWSSSWSWTRADGSEFKIDFATMTAT